MSGINVLIVSLAVIAAIIWGLTKITPPAWRLFSKLQSVTVVQKSILFVGLCLLSVLFGNGFQASIDGDFEDVWGLWIILTASLTVFGFWLWVPRRFEED